VDDFSVEEASHLVSVDYVVSEEWLGGVLMKPVVVVSKRRHLVKSGLAAE